MPGPESSATPLRTSVTAGLGSPPPCRCCSFDTDAPARSEAGGRRGAGARPGHRDEWYGHHGRDGAPRPARVRADDRPGAAASAAAAAVAAVRSGQRVFVHGGAAVPRALLAALVARAGELRDVELVHLHTLGPAPYAAPELAGSFRHRALFVGANVREAVQAGRADFVPVFLSDIPDLFRSGRLPLDVALLNVSPPDAHGFCSLGTSVDVAKAAAESARTGDRPAQPRGAPQPGRLLRPRRPLPRHGGGGRAPGGGGPAGARARRRRPSGPTSPGWWRTGPPSSWASGPSPTPCSPPCGATATWACTRRCSATGWSSWCRPG